MRLPNLQQRILILGRTGSGKSRAAVWHLAQKNLVSKIWICLNHKCEELIDSIPGAQHVDVDFRPKKSGLYIYHPIPENDDEKVEELLWYIHARENIGLYIDEAYSVNPRSPALIALYTQGRSKHIPMITLSQRPSAICRFAVSESDFYQLFPLNDIKDRQRVQGFIPFDLETILKQEAGQDIKLPEFHSIYYDVGKNDLAIMAPVPSDDLILDMFERQLKNNSKKFLL